MSTEHMLTAHERSEIERAKRAGRDVSAPIGVTYFFSAPGPGPEPVKAVAALRESGLDVVVDEELSGDGYWHIAAFADALLTPFAIRLADSAMERVAAQTSIHHDGWRVSLTIGEGG